MDDKFSPHILEVATALWGEQNKSLSKPGNPRWGTHGARAIDVKRGVWSDHQENVGGGVLDLIMREKGLSKAAAAGWMADQGYISNDRSGSGQGDGRAPSNKDFGPNLDPDDPGHSGATSEGNASAPPDPKAQIVKTYDYTDENGALIFQVCRMEVPDRPDIPKTFRQRRPDGKGGWDWKVKGTRQVPYKLPELIAAVKNGLIIFVAEGEKDVDALRDMGLPATCNAGGAGKWPDGLIAFFHDARVVMLPDNDPPGKKHRNIVGAALRPVVREISWLDLPDLPEKGDPFDWIASGGDAPTLYDLIDANATEWTPSVTFETRFKAIRWGDLDHPGYEHEWLIKGLLTRRERSMVAGPSGGGKSFFCLDMALAVARGTGFFGHKVAHRGGVIYQAGEGGRGIKKRLRAYQQERGVTTADNLPFILLPSVLDLHGSDDPTKAFIEEVHHWSSTFDTPLELIIIDTLSAATPGANENTSEDMSRVLARCERIVEATRAHVLLVHHLNADGTKPRGHTSVFANLENVIEVRKTEETDSQIIVTDFKTGDPRTIRREIRRAIVTKQKDEESGANIDFVLHSVLIDTDADGDPVTSCVIDPPERAALENVAIEYDRGINLTPQCAAYLNAVIEALKDHSEPADPDTGLPRSWRVVRHNHVKRIFEQTSFEINEDDDADDRSSAVKKAITRHGSFLVKNGIIRKHDKVVWLTGKKVKGFKTKDHADSVPDPVETSPPDLGEASDDLPF